MIPINYHHLYYFWTVAKAGSITAARERLYLSQPTLSGQLLALEKSCGAPLLVRGRKGVTLTPQGRVVFAHCDRIFTEGDELVAAVKRGFSGPAVLRLGVQPAISRDVVVQMLDFAQKRDKNLRIAIVHGEAEALSAKLRQRSLDFVVASDDLAVELGREFRSRLVCQIPAFFVASPKLRGLVRKFPADLTRTPMLLRPPENPVRKQVDHYLGRNSVFTTLGADLEDVGLIRRLAIEGKGVAAMNSLSIAADLKSGRLVKLHRSPVGIHERIWFVDHKHAGHESEAQAMSEALMEDFRVRFTAP